jgi:prepilin-type N-terminal cleavage/methylation domain-containing protein
MRRRAGESGFTLIETLASLMIFSLVTLGTTPLLLSSVRGAALSRTYVTARNLASEAMERVRGFPFFESMKNQVSPPRRDVLDLYFPDRTAGTGGTGFSVDKFTTTCTASSKLPAASAVQACPVRIPDGYTLKYEAQFVNPGPAPGAGGTQTFIPVAPATNYNWNATATESPPSRLLLIKVTASWTASNKARSYSLSSLIGTRHLTDELFRARGKVGAAVLVRTSFVDASGRVSALTVNAGEAESTLASRALAEAGQEVRGGRATLVRAEYTDGSTVVPAATLQDLSGATAVLHAPPNPSVSQRTGGNFTLTHSELTPSMGVSFVGATIVNETGAATQVTNELPLAAGNMRYTGNGSNPTLWVSNQADIGTSSELLLSPQSAEGMVTFVRNGSTTTNRMNASTSAQAFALTTAGGGYVESKANASFTEMRLFPTTYITSTSRAVVLLKNFTASLTCKAVASTGTPLATGTWSATLSYWQDANPADGLPTGAYVDVPISGTTSSGGGTVLNISGNPLVYERTLATSADDLYLFRDDATGKKGYLLEMTSSPLIPATNTGGATTVTMDNAVEIITAPTKAGVPDSALNLTIGALSCEAVDNR